MTVDFLRLFTVYPFHSLVQSIKAKSFRKNELPHLQMLKEEIEQVNNLSSDLEVFDKTVIIKNKFFHKIKEDLLKYSLVFNEQGGIY